MFKSRLSLMIGLFLGSALLIGLLFTLSSPGQAQDQPPILEMPDLPPTPTPAAPPSAELSANPLAAIDFDATSALDQLRFSDPEALWLIEDGALNQEGVGKQRAHELRDVFGLLDADIPANGRVVLSAYNERSGVADVLARASTAGFYRYRVLADSYTGTHHRLELVQGDQVTLLAESNAPGLIQYQWHTLTLEMEADQLVASFDGTEMLRASDSTLSAGDAGLGSMAIGGIRFGSLEVLP